ncbi:hypothetical protein NicSoilB11_24870 [Arthrobacter sp. NicSoilB11]|nr:hypothetical protein NicSoilB11_24870 [Arthrobacter sp. NicSoilB11]
MDSVVVLPAPLGPTIPKNEPAGTSRLMPSTAIFPPNLLASPRMDRAATGPVFGAGDGIGAVMLPA